MSFVIIFENIHDEFFPYAMVHEDGTVEGSDGLQKEIEERGLFSRKEKEFVKNGPKLLDAVLQKYNSGYFSAKEFDEDELEGSEEDMKLLEKAKSAIELKVIVLEKIPTEDKNVWNYRCGVSAE